MTQMETNRGGNTYMRIIIRICIISLCLLALTTAWATVSKHNTPPPGYKAMFNGKDLTGWRMENDADKHWKVKDGIIEFDGKGENLRTVKDYRNFVMMVEWKIGKGGDSGIYLRGKPQVQIWDNPIGSGGLYNDQVDPTKNVDKPVGEWNTFLIRLNGDKVTVIENGVLIVNCATMKNLPERGPIELQNHGNPLWFRNIYIKELPDR